MRIEIKDNLGQPRLTVHVDPEHPPTVVHADDGRGPKLTLDWDQALDDHGRLRHCPVCNCPDFYVRKQVPQLTVFALVIAAAVVAILFHGFGLSKPALIVLAVVLGIDLLIYLYAARYLVCYDCASEFHDTRAVGHPRPWDAATAERHKSSSPAPGNPPADPPGPREPTEALN